MQFPHPAYNTGYNQCCTFPVLPSLAGNTIVSQQVHSLLLQWLHIFPCGLGSQYNAATKVEPTQFSLPYYTFSIYWLCFQLPPTKSAVFIQCLRDSIMSANTITTMDSVCYSFSHVVWGHYKTLLLSTSLPAQQILALFNSLSKSLTYTQLYLSHYVSKHHTQGLHTMGSCAVHFTCGMRSLNQCCICSTAQQVA